MGDKSIRSMAEFERRYFPDRVKKREEKELQEDPSRYGKWLAKKYIEQLRKALRGKNDEKVALLAL